MQMIFFVREKGERRMVSIYDDGSYRINHGKKHEDFNKYYKDITAKGWVKADFYKYCEQERRKEIANE